MMTYKLNYQQAYLEIIDKLKIFCHLSILEYYARSSFLASHTKGHTIFMTKGALREYL